MFLWNRILLPLLVTFGIIVVSILIVVLWSALTDFIFARKEQRKIKRAVKQEVKENCAVLREMIDEFFAEMIELKLNQLQEEEKEENED